jgi:Type III restriction enzyme, res subunit
VVGDNKRRSFHLLVGATLTIGTSVVGSQLTASLTDEQSWGIRLVWLAAGIAVTFFYLRWQLRSQEESPEAIKERVSQLESELRKQVQSRSYGARRNLIEAPLRELDLDITPRLGGVRDPRLVEPESLSEQITDDIVAAFESSKRRMLIVGEPGSGKTMAAFSLIEYLDEREGDERIPLLVNLSAWEARETFEAFLVDYLCSSVGYEVRERSVASAFISFDRYSLTAGCIDTGLPAGRSYFGQSDKPLVETTNVHHARWVMFTETRCRGCPRCYRTTSRRGHCSKSCSLSSSKGPTGTLSASASSTVLASLGT